MHKKGFTLSEVMVTMAVLSVLFAILIPAVQSNIPNKSKIMFRKSYSDIERVVDMLISDDTLYPGLTDINGNEIGFLNTALVSLEGQPYLGATKFCNLFAQKVNTSGVSTCAAITTANESTFNGNTSSSFVTTNGVTWAIRNDAFGSGTVPTTTNIYVDVVGGITNTTKNNPNCTIATCPAPDRFVIPVLDNGKILLTDTKAIEYLKDFSVK